MEAELVQLEGSVASVVFQNPENGYTVLRLKIGANETATVVGTVPVTAVGERLRVEGVWNEHSSYGRQLEIRTVERLMPENRIEILAYLSSHAIRGVGPKLAARIVERFGAESLRVIENEPARLAEITGISPAKAAEIHESFQSQQGLRHLVEFLAQYELPTELAVSVFRAYGELSMMAIQDNPYFLTEESYHADFSKVDAFALSLGFDGADERRVDAGVLYELSYNCRGGHSFVPRDALVSVSASFLGLPQDVICVALDRLAAQERIITDPIAGLEAVYLPEYGRAERELAARFLEMADSVAQLPTNLARAVAEVEAAAQIEYAELQKEALYAAATDRLLLVTGGPGTGKTTILRGVLELYDRMRLKTLLAAPTGRAAKRLSEVTGRDASTIHRLLEVDISPESGEMVFAHNARNPLSCDAVIVDECSMVDLLLMHDLVSALPPKCRLILVGDPDQLPPVGAGSVFSDLIRSERIPMIRLTEIFRQARESLIVMNAHRVNHGEMPMLDEKKRDFFFLQQSSDEAVSRTITDLCSRRLPQNMGIPAEEIQVLSPTRKGETGTRALNQMLQAALNPPAAGKAEKKYGDFSFRVGDRVMQIRNNYNIIWRRDGASEMGSGVFNGDVGIIRDIDYQAQNLTIHFDDRVAVYTWDMLSQLEPAFAMTVHKSQGSEYRAVILCAWRGTPLLLSRSILYTAITRARELLIVVGDRGVIEYMVGNDKKQKRFSGLRWRLRNP
ncbi:MAG: ATP-dependent RecD-like DNA helicase [Oscillospiraceae bacterium]|nr:ATP-dependent RecD-like DNA helicase [Oscillospiraceae bacterium]